MGGEPILRRSRWLNGSKTCAFLPSAIFCSRGWRQCWANMECFALPKMERIALNIFNELNMLYRFDKRRGQGGCDDSRMFEQDDEPKQIEGL
jgi:hypothetical protein